MSILPDKDDPCPRYRQWELSLIHIYPDEHTGEMVWAIRKVNDLLGPGGPILQPGQELWIPDPAMYGVGVIDND